MKGLDIRRLTFVAATPGIGRADTGRITNQSTILATVSNREKTPRSRRQLAEEWGQGNEDHILIPLPPFPCQIQPGRANESSVVAMSAIRE